MEDVNKMFEKSLNHLIGLFKKSEDYYFLREADLQSFLYRDLWNKIRKHKNLFCSWKNKTYLFPVHTEHQYNHLKPKAKSLGGQAIDLVILSPDEKIGIDTALEIKFSTPVTGSGAKQSAGKGKLGDDIDKLNEKIEAKHKYFLFVKEDGINCFITSNNVHGDENREQFFKKFLDKEHKTIPHLWMYYVEKVNKHVEKKFYLYTISKKDYNPIPLASKKEYNPKEHFNIIIHSNSKTLKEWVKGINK